jgi:hypothetical protein
MAMMLLGFAGLGFVGYRRNRGSNRSGGVEQGAEAPLAAAR